MFLTEFQGLWQNKSSVTIDWENVKNYITHTKSCVEGDIISSQIDVDRFDFLLRDSHFCGVKYGLFDLDWLIRSLIKIEISPTTRLGVSHKGEGAAEHYLLARRMMTKYVYHHPKCAVLAALMKLFLERIGTSVEDSKIEFTPSYLHNFFKEAEQFRRGFKSKDSFIASSYGYYKHITDFDIWQLMIHIDTGSISFDKDKSNKQIKKLASIFLKRRLPKVLRIVPGRVDDF